MPAATIEGKIHDALYARCVALATSLSLPLSWRGFEFTPPASKKWLRGEFFPNTTNRVTIGSDDPHQYLGLLQIAVHWPQGEGEADLREKAGEVIAYFQCDLKLTEGGVTVRITKRPEAAEVMVDDQDLFIPVTVSFEAFA